MEPGAILMPGYVNIGAGWEEHGGHLGHRQVLRPDGRGCPSRASASVGCSSARGDPVIIEDGAFIGSRAIVVEGVRVGKEAVVAANVVLTASAIIDVTGSEVVHKGVVPPQRHPRDSAQDPAGTYQLACALIIGQRKESTDRKTSLNDVLREFAVGLGDSSPSRADPGSSGGTMSGALSCGVLGAAGTALASVFENGQ